MKKIFLSLALILGCLTACTPVFATVSSTTDKIIYSGNGTTTAFTFPFNVYLTTDLSVQKLVVATGVVTTLTINIDYTVALTHSAPSPGTVTMLSAPAAGTSIVILRSLPYTQLISVADNSPTPASVTNQVYDRGVMLSQQLKEMTDRSILQNAFSSSTLTFPSAVSGQCVGWSASSTLTNLACSGSSGGGGTGFNPPIPDSQLSAITSSSKVNGSSLYSLSSIPVGAGLIPNANLNIGTSVNQIASFGLFGYPAASGSQITGISGANLVSLASIPSGSGKIPVANLGTGTPSASNFLRGDGAFAAASGALTLTSNTPVVAAATTGAIAITNTKYYKVVFHLGNLSAADTLYLRFNGESGAGLYAFSYGGRTSGGALTGGSDSATQITLGTAIRNSSIVYADGEFMIFPQVGVEDISASGQFRYRDNAGALNTFINFTGNYAHSLAATSFAIVSAGGATFTGTVLVYEMLQS